VRAGLSSVGQLHQGTDVGGVVPQQPPITCTPRSSTKCSSCIFISVRCEPVVGDSADVLRQAGVGDAAHHEGAVGAQVADVLLHLLRAGGAVEAEHVDR
jgi:hypothetical protein